MLHLFEPAQCLESLLEFSNMDISLFLFGWDAEYGILGAQTAKQRRYQAPTSLMFEPET